MPSESSKVAELARASADPSVSASAVVELVRHIASEATDKKIRGFAADVLARKCINASTKEWDDVLTALKSNETDVDVYLVNIASLGKMFGRELDENTARARLDILLHLIDDDPSDPCLHRPYCYDVSDEDYEVLKTEWLTLLGKQINEPSTLRNAARFFFGRDVQQAERVIRMGMELEPDNEWWKERLNKLREFHAPRDA